MLKNHMLEKFYLNVNPENDADTVLELPSARPPNEQRVAASYEYVEPSQPLMKRLDNFGTKELKDSEIDFIWPTEKDLQKMKLPLKLKEIRTRGVTNSCLTGIQLVFHNGIESPVFDTQHENAT